MTSDQSAEGTLRIGEEEEAERVGTRDGWPVFEGEKYAQSPITETWYRVSKWMYRGDGRMTALRKTEVDRDDVPQEVLHQ